MKVLPQDILNEFDQAKLSPMMRQYIVQKRKHPDCLLFFRLGDFYEMFFDDAIIASEELEIALTARDCGMPNKAPMCGVPYHAAENYISKLSNKNYKLAICEQLQDPAQAKGIVERGIVRIVTPGTVTNLDNLDEGSHNYIAAIYASSDYFGLAVSDITTGEFKTSSIITEPCVNKLRAEIAAFRPAELICNDSFAKNHNELYLELQKLTAVINVLPESCFQEADKYDLINESRGNTDKNFKTSYLWKEACSGLLYYIQETQQELPSNLQSPEFYFVEKYLGMNDSCRMNLELTENIRDKKKYGSLLWVLDRTCCSMGQRCLKSYINQALVNLDEINYRQAAVAELKENYIARQNLRLALKGIKDIARLTGKLSRKQINARDLLALASSLANLPQVRESVSTLSADNICSLAKELYDFTELRALIAKSIKEDAPLFLKEGGIIKAGFSKDLDDLHDLAGGGKRWLIDFEQREKEATGIKNLRISYNRVFGYYIEITKSNLALVPEHYHRKQTLVNSERFITEELKNKENAILSAKQRLENLEYELFYAVHEEVSKYEQQLLRSANALAHLDALQSLAEVADSENYCRPQLDESGVFIVKDGRHPVLEQVLPAGDFVYNDANLSVDDKYFALITGPNMGGKSTYMRQLALIALMAQIGSFVPAREAHIGIIDQIFTRIGASDDLSSGLSTFMLEMQELSFILNNATEKSFIVLDEVGRGTSTFDGLAIAWAVTEYLSDKNYVGARTVFATHYHELVDLEQLVPAVFNLHVTVEERNKEIFFLHKIAEGGADESYGIEVAKRSGIPSSVILRSRELIKVLEKANQNRKKLRTNKISESMPGEQNLFSAQLQYGRYMSLVSELQNLRIEQLSPLDALNLLDKLHREAEKLDG